MTVFSDSIEGLLGEIFEDFGTDSFSMEDVIGCEPVEPDVGHIIQFISVARQALQRLGREGYVKKVGDRYVVTDDGVAFFNRRAQYVLGKINAISRNDSKLYWERIGGRPFSHTRSNEDLDFDILVNIMSSHSFRDTDNTFSRSDYLYGLTEPKESAIESYEVSLVDYNEKIDVFKTLLSQNLLGLTEYGSYCITDEGRAYLYHDSRDYDEEASDCSDDEEEPY